ncbi:MAG: DUF6519 domain-containing protein [Rhodanobacter sp.]
MKGDFARVTFDPARHYSQVFQQQGRVLLEADWNEQGQIQLRLLRALVKDLIGPCWAAGDSFRLATSDTEANGQLKRRLLGDWELAAGHFYVDGILCENEVACVLPDQPYRPTPDYGISDGSTGFEHEPPKGFAVWLDVWERHLSSIEAPAIADVALNGVDTASRAQVVWQVRLLDGNRAKQQLDTIEVALKSRPTTGISKEEAAAIKQQMTDLEKLRKSLDGGDGSNDDLCAVVRQLLGARDNWAQPRMSAQLEASSGDDDPCVIAADARYRGCENQLYRVEIHSPGLAGTAAGASFKWSRENGSVIFPVIDSTASSPADDGGTSLVVTLARLGRDARLGLAVNDWVELVDDDYTLAQRALVLLQVVAVDVAEYRVTLALPAHATAYPLSLDPSKHPLLRRWDQRESVGEQGVLAMTEGTALTLEDGIQVTFQPGGVYATGDYWLIPARVAGSGRLDWPSSGSAAAALPPRGGHHYAVLGVSSDQNPFAECCCRFGPLCESIGANRGLPSVAGDHRVDVVKLSGDASTKVVAVTPKPQRIRKKPAKTAKPA